MKSTLVYLTAITSTLQQCTASSPFFVGLLNLPQQRSTGGPHPQAHELSVGVDTRRRECRSNWVHLRPIVPSPSIFDVPLRSIQPASLVHCQLRVGARDQMGSQASKFREAAVEGDLQRVDRYIRRGGNVNVVDERGYTALHNAALMGHWKVVSCLIDAGADVNAKDQSGYTALHVASASGHDEVVSCLIDAGANIHAKTQDGRTPLHVASRLAYVEVASRLIDAGADVNANQEHGLTPLQVSLSIREERPLLSMLFVFMRSGAVWDDSWKPDNWVDRALFTRSRLVIQEWTAQRQQGLPLTELPYEVFERGEADIMEYFRAINESVLGRLSRKKLCVVGPSGWGKTSLIKTFLTHTPVQEDEDERTIGIDTFTWEFTARDNAQYSVSLWDFAGQDEYHPAHALFYSARTLYLLVVDLGEYAKVLDEGEIRKAQFFEQHIYRWVRTICAHVPDSEFVFVATKSDRVGHDGVKILRIMGDVRERFERCEAMRLTTLHDEIKKIETKMTQTTKADIAALMKQKLDKLQHQVQQQAKLRDGWLALCSYDSTGWAAMTEQLQELIVSGGSSFVMPRLYSDVLRALSTMKDEAGSSVYNRAQKTCVLFDALLDELLKRGLSVDRSSLQAIMHTLHDRGDILWFDGVGDDKALQECIFIDTNFVIDLIRAVVNHKYATSNDGSDDVGNAHGQCVSGMLLHEALMAREPWCYLSSDLVLKLKQLLHRFRLAYPTREPMEEVSDLMVPALWASRSPSKSLYHQQRLFDHEVHWVYVFMSYVPDDLFEKFAVKSHSCARIELQSKPTFGRNYFDMVGSKCAALITRQNEMRGLCPKMTLGIQARGLKLETAWQILVAHCAALEELLKGYPGVYVVRSAIRHDQENGQVYRYGVDDLLAMVDRDAPDSTPADIGLFLPPDMSWYTGEQRHGHIWSSSTETIKRGNTWENKPSSSTKTLTRGYTHDLLSHLLNGMEELKTISLDDRRRVYPSLWKVTHTPPSQSLKKDVFTIEIFSCVSGKCFHEPLTFEAYASTLGSLSPYLTTGVSILVGVVFENLIQGTGVKERYDKCVDEASKFQEVLRWLSCGMKNGTLDASKVRPVPQQMMDSFLMQLMKLYDPSFECVHFAHVTQLQCVWHKGIKQFLWLHESEIAAHATAGELRRLGDTIGVGPSQTRAKGA